ncbi:NUDIX domain-containing protein [Hyphomicrobiales bacterium]|uniref:NUDIX domain-containing protein n=1 Tax=Rhizobium sp. TaxID=391 RepID=UPI0013AF5F57
MRTLPRRYLGSLHTPIFHHRYRFLLISSLDTDRRVIPNGNLNAKERSFRCAEREAFEEAGVVREMLIFVPFQRDNASNRSVLKS